MGDSAGRHHSAPDSRFSRHSTSQMLGLSLTLIVLAFSFVIYDVGASGDSNFLSEDDDLCELEVRSGVMIRPGRDFSNERMLSCCHGNDNHCVVSIVTPSAVGDVLEEVARQAGIAVIYEDDLDLDHVIGPLLAISGDQFIRELLGNHDYFLYYRRGRIEAIWIYPANKGRGLSPVPPHLWASTAELERWAGDDDPEKRVMAITELVQRKRASVVPAVLAALDDEAADVRANAIYAAIEAGVEVPRERLLDLLRSDPAEEVRFLALQALARLPNAHVVALEAVEDRSSHVRDLARVTLRSIGAAIYKSERASEQRGSRRQQRR